VGDRGRRRRRGDRRLPSSERTATRTGGGERELETVLRLMVPQGTVTHGAVHYSLLSDRLDVDDVAAAAGRAALEIDPRAATSRSPAPCGR